MTPALFHYKSFLVHCAVIAQNAYIMAPKKLSANAMETPP